MTCKPNTQNLPSAEEILKAARSVAENTIGEPKTVTTKDIIRELPQTRPFHSPTLSQYISQVLRDNGYRPLSNKTTRYRRYLVPLLTSP